MTTVIQLGEALRYFFNHAKINIYQGHIAINLMDYFPALKNGYLLPCAGKDVFDIMMDNYISVNHSVRENFLSDVLFIKSFNSDIPAHYYHYYKNLYDDDILAHHYDYYNDIIYNTISMQKAVKLELVPKPLNTYQVIERLRLWDNLPKLSPTEMIYRTRRCNVTSIIMKQDTNLINQMNNESQLALDISHMLMFYASFMYIEPKINLRLILLRHNKKLTSQLLTNDWVKLLHDIFMCVRRYPIVPLNNIDSLITSLYKTDPRLYNNEAYHLASQWNQSPINDLIRDAIIER